MLIDHLLLAIGHQHHHKTVIACDDSTELKAVHEEKRHRHLAQTADGLWYYVNYNNSSYRCVYSYAYKGTDAFYVVQYIINTVDEETLKPIIHDWAKATSVK